jgi:hypothetical protein
MPREPENPRLAARPTDLQYKPLPSPYNPFFANALIFKVESLPSAMIRTSTHNPQGDYSLYGWLGQPPDSQGYPQGKVGLAGSGRDRLG